MIEIWIISFLTDKFLYPCVSFVYLSLLSLSVLLFKIFNFRFHVFLTGLFPHAFSRLLLFGTTLVRDRFDSRVYICRIFFCSFRSRLFSNYDMFFPGLLFAEIFSLLKILMVEKLIVKNLSTLDGLEDNSLLMGAPPHMAILPG